MTRRRRPGDFRAAGNDVTATEPDTLTRGEYMRLRGYPEPKPEVSHPVGHSTQEDPMTDHHHHQDDEDLEVQRILAAIDADALPWHYEPAPDPPPDQARALLAAAQAEGADTSTGRFAWCVTHRATEDVDGLPAGIEEHRTLVFTNCPVDTP